MAAHRFRTHYCAICFGAALLVGCDTTPADPAARRSAHGVAAGTLLDRVFTWTGSTVRVEQVIGDTDWQAAGQWLRDNRGSSLPNNPFPNGVPTTGQTGSQFNVYGTDLGSSFDLGDSLVFMFGDTDTGNHPNNAVDVMGKSGAASGDDPLQLRFGMNGSAPFRVISSGNHPMGPFNVPNAGIFVNGTTYIVVNTDASQPPADPHSTSRSMLLRYNAGSTQFDDVRQISTMPNGHFVFTALAADTLPGTYERRVLIFGTGAYRASNIYLSWVSGTHFGDAAPTTYYYAGRDANGAILSNLESDAQPIVIDDPSFPTAGNVSVAHPDPSYWIMLYDGGRQSAATHGIYFTYAMRATGPWATPQLIFNVDNDGAKHTFIHGPCPQSDATCLDDMLDGPVTGGADPITTPGAAYAPMLIGRFTRLQDHTLTIYFLLSTWNPYTVVKMKSTFTVGVPSP